MAPAVAASSTPIVVVGKVLGVKTPAFDRFFKVADHGKLIAVSRAGSQLSTVQALCRPAAAALAGAASCARCQ